MSTGVVLAWATEAQQKNLVSTEETMGLTFNWGDAATYIQAIDHIVKQPNEFYRYLASGVDAASARYGGADFAMAFGGNEMPGYHTGSASHISFLVGSRHSHLDAAGYSIDQNILKGKALSDEDVVKELLKEEAWRQILSSLVVCFFARGIYDPETVVKTLEVAGHKVSLEGLDRLGMEILREKNRFKAREGFKPESLRVPARIYETPSPRGLITEDVVKNSVERFFKELGI